jgi:hypothetical protein
MLRYDDAIVVVKYGGCHGDDKVARDYAATWFARTVRVNPSSSMAAARNRRDARRLGIKSAFSTSADYRPGTMKLWRCWPARSKADRRLHHASGRAVLLRQGWQYGGHESWRNGTKSILVLSANRPVTGQFWINCSGAAHRCAPVAQGRWRDL